MGPAGQYISVGFKEQYAAYYGWDRVRDIAEYWGMATSPSVNNTDLAGRILVAYGAGNQSSTGSRGSGCVRHMKADAYVGSIVDTLDDGVIRNASVTVVDSSAGP